jgi:cyanophycin synthetase
VVVRITKPTGWAVLNADDDLVWAMRTVTRAKIWAYSLDPDTPRLAEALDSGGRAITVVDGEIVVLERALDPVRVLPVRSVPLTLGGASTVNVSNVLAATAAVLGIGCPLDDVRTGLASFTASAELNAGRLNCYLVGDDAETGTVVILDLAHNEASLASLLDVGANLRRRDGELVVVVTTAGDRSDEAIHQMGAIAAAAADRMATADKEYYLRGRAPGEMDLLWRSGAAEAGITDVPGYPDELTALRAQLDAGLPAGSVIAVSTLEQRAECVAEIEARGGHELTAGEVTARTA